MISIIIPIYNVEKYLDECLTSVMNQTYKNFEVILVNDGTKDNSIEIVNKFISKHNNIKLVNKENGGLGSARNVGINHARGKYLIFIDSDDYIEATYIEKLYTEIEKSKSDIVICGINKYYENSKNIEPVNLEVENNKSYSSLEAIKLLFTNKIFCHAWNRIYRKELFINNNILFPEGKLYEDILPAVKLISKSKKISFIKENLYYYRIREGAITSSKNIKAIEDYNYAIDKVNKYISTSVYEESLKSEKVNFNISYTLSSLDMLSIYTDYNKRKFYREYNIRYNKNYMEYGIIKVLSNKDINKWVKRDYLLFKMGLLPLKNKIRDKY